MDDERWYGTYRNYHYMRHPSKKLRHALQRSFIIGLKIRETFKTAAYGGPPPPHTAIPLIFSRTGGFTNSLLSMDLLRGTVS